MAYIAAFIIFGLATLAIWFVAIAIYEMLSGDTGIRKNPQFGPTTAVGVSLVTVIAFAPFWISYALSFAVWGLAARNLLGANIASAVLLFVLLAAMSIVSRLVMLGIMNF